MSARVDKFQRNFNHKQIQCVDWCNASYMNKEPLISVIARNFWKSFLTCTSCNCHIYWYLPLLLFSASTERVYFIFTPPYLHLSDHLFISVKSQLNTTPYFNSLLQREWQLSPKCISLSVPVSYSTHCFSTPRFVHASYTAP